MGAASSVPGPPGLVGDDGEDSNQPGPQGLTGEVGPQGVTGAQPDDLLALLRYFETRLDFMEAALKIHYRAQDILIPEAHRLLEG